METEEVEGEGSELKSGRRRSGGGEWEEEKEECGRHSSPTPCKSPLQRVWKLQLTGLKGCSVRWKAAGLQAFQSSIARLHPAH